MLYSKFRRHLIYAVGASLPLTLCASSAYALEPQKNLHEQSGAHLLLDVVFGMHTAETEHLRNVFGTVAETPEGAALARPATAIRATQSLLFAGVYSINDSAHVGARLAVTLGSTGPAVAAINSNVAALSNTELEAERLWRLAPDTEAAFGIGLVLPSAPGHEPEDDLAPSAAHASFAELTNLGGELSEAAAAARGFEDSALFRAERIGVIPRLHLVHHTSRLRIESQVKLENLLSVRGAPHHTYLGELVVAGFYGYVLRHEITLGVRLWSNILIEDVEQNMLVCEPQLQIHTHHVQGLVGAIMPIVQRRDSPTGLAGLRIAAAAAF